jgi:ubiquinone/menaquinone biosynthesis C-methylase UbiE
MDTQQAYNHWAHSYDSDDNKTRDLELVAGQQVLTGADFSKVLEIGCGTGKNTVWLAEKATTLTAVDFSEEMMKLARQKVNCSHVQFRQADITKPWNFGSATLITCSLVLEHIQDIDFIFAQAAKTLEPDGWLYVCELHPYKQLQGSRARFEREGRVVQLEYFVHHISDFFSAGQKSGLQCKRLDEWFDSKDRTMMPRLVSFLFQRTRQ